MMFQGDSVEKLIFVFIFVKFRKILKKEDRGIVISNKLACKNLLDSNYLFINICLRGKFRLHDHLEKISLPFYDDI